MEWFQTVYSAFTFDFALKKEIITMNKVKSIIYRYGFIIAERTIVKKENVIGVNLLILFYHTNRFQ